MIQNLDYHLVEFSANFSELVGQVHFAADAAEARELVLGIAERTWAKLARHRPLPEPAARSFRERFRELDRER
ncbi:MAG TPA: hypothetical protein VHV51_14110 [Polyangiaceae bacterium]|nr:hypothetical protein [Polyangiaceae bacterium]